MLDRVQICDLEMSRLIIGGNPFSGFSHQSRERDEEMMNYYTTARIKETLNRAYDAGINTAVMRSDRHIHRLLREYYNEGGQIQWIAQVGGPMKLERAVNSAVAAGAVAIYMHGGLLDRYYVADRAKRVRELVDHIHSHDLPAGFAGHSPQAHLWAHESGAELDFQTVAFYNCGTLHDGKGDKFDAGDPPKAVEAIRKIPRPVLGYKIMAAGRVDPREAFEFAFDNMKDTDAVVVGMYLGDNENMIEDNVAMVSEILNEQTRRRR